MFSKFSSPQLRLEAPLFIIGSWPVRLVTLLIALHVSAMIATSLLVTVGDASWIQLLAYNSTAVGQGQLWRLLTYAFVNPPNIWFGFEMLMLFFFGREVERGLGAKSFGLFYGGLIILGSLLLQLFSLGGTAQEMTGAQAVNFAVFAAFVTMYPGVQFLFGITARWMLLAFLVLSSLQLMEGQQFASTLLFLAESLAAILFMKWNGYHELIAKFSLPSFRELLQKMAPRRAPKTGAVTSSSTSSRVMDTCSTSTSFITVPKATAEAPKKTKPSTSPIKNVNIDDLLEKISKTGMASLSDQEKEQLEAARMALLKRDKATSRL